MLGWIKEIRKMFPNHHENGGGCMYLGASVATAPGGFLLGARVAAGTALNHQQAEIFSLYLF